MLVTRLASHAVSLEAVEALLAAARRAHAEMLEFGQRVHFVPAEAGEPFQHYVIQRRR